MSDKLGYECKLYYKVGGQSGGGAWTELTNVRDATLTLERDSADVTTRANNGWKAERATLRNASIEFEMVWNTADAGFAAIKDVYLGVEDMIGIQALDGESGEGLQGDFGVFSFTRTEELAEGVKVSVVLRPTYSTTAPTWIGGS